MPTSGERRSLPRPGRRQRMTRSMTKSPATTDPTATKPCAHEMLNATHRTPAAVGNNATMKTCNNRRHRHAKWSSSACVTLSCLLASWRRRNSTATMMMSSSRAENVQQWAANATSGSPTWVDSDVTSDTKAAKPKPTRIEQIVLQAAEQLVDAGMVRPIAALRASRGRDVDIASAPARTTDLVRFPHLIATPAGVLATSVHSNLSSSRYCSNFSSSNEASLPLSNAANRLIGIPSFWATTS